jgi:hypothetical protein
MTKINQILQQWPHGVVLTAERLRELGCGPELVRRYRLLKWLESLGWGAYKRPEDQVDCLGGVYALQTQLGLTVHPGGKTALGLKGLSHDVSQEAGQVFLFGRRGERLPKWFEDQDWGRPIHYQATTLLPAATPAHLSDHEHGQFTVKISCRELAALEMLYHVPSRQGFEEASLIMDNLATLRPTVAQALLQDCGSVKVKRLFLFMAERAGHPWFGKLDASSIDLGKGKRVIVKGGMLDKKYGITVPRGQGLCETRPTSGKRNSFSTCYL